MKWREGDTLHDDGALVSLDGMVFGMPPSTHVSDSILLNSMPTATITPCEPEFSSGLSLFRLDQSKGLIEYKAILESVGFSFTGNTVKVAYLADNFPTDTFSNEYGETFLDKFSQVASSGLGDVAQMAGWTSSKVAKDQIGDVLANVPGGQSLNNLLGGFAEKSDAAAANMSASNRQMYESMKSTVGSVLTGARVDFPQVWKNSSFSPSYSMTIRLYNPNPASRTATRKYIVGPIAALVALATPKVAEDSTTYKWPLLCKVRSPGIYHLNAAYINSISVIKGGDQQSIAYNQNMAMCDVRIDFGSLYRSILAGKGSDKWGHRRPTLGTYLESIGGKSVTGADTHRKVVKAKINNQSVNDPYLAHLNKKQQLKSSDITPSTPPSSRVQDENSLRYAALLNGGHPIT